MGKTSLAMNLKRRSQKIFEKYSENIYEIPISRPKDLVKRNFGGSFLGEDSRRISIYGWI